MLVVLPLVGSLFGERSGSLLKVSDISPPCRSTGEDGASKPHDLAFLDRRL